MYPTKYAPKGKSKAPIKSESPHIIIAHQGPSNIPESIIGINENEITTIGVLIDKNLLRTIVVASSKPASIVCLIFDIKKYTPFTKF